MASFLPEGLTSAESRDLYECVTRAEALSMEALLAAAREHLVGTRSAHKQNPLVDLALAEALLGCIETVVKEWASIPPFAHSWCKGMILYFSGSNAEEDDHLSPIGFDDDAEVINACLRVAGRDDLCVDPEDV